MKTDKLITKLNLCESGSEETRNQMLARVFEEPALLKPKTAYMHARDVIKGVWVLGEEVIQESAQWSYEYAVFTKERFIEGEKAIAMDARLSIQYALDVLHGPFPAGEPVISETANKSYAYAAYVLHGPFPAGEPAIATDAEFSYKYAADILHGPFPAGEAAIATYTKISEWYVDEVLNGDWSRFNRRENI